MDTKPKIKKTRNYLFFGIMQNLIYLAVILIWMTTIFPLSKANISLKTKLKYRIWTQAYKVFFEFLPVV